MHLAHTCHHRPEAYTLVTCHLDPLVPALVPAAPLTVSDYLTYRDAVAFARSAHAGQKRADGRAYLSHPLAVLQILRSVSLSLPYGAYIAALLHDTVEDGHATVQQIRDAFGDETADVVAALTRPMRPKGIGILEHEQTYLDQMATANEQIPYVLLLKMADRLHNLETSHFCAPAYRQVLLDETASLYLPLLEQEEAYQSQFTDAYRTLFTLLEQSVESQAVSPRA